jgi:Niemann-Pick C2 protein
MTGLSVLAANSIRGIEAKVRATVLGITVDYPLPEPDACQSLVDSACPFEAGDLGTYKLDLPISEAVPQVNSL